MKLSSNYLLEIINQAFQVLIPIITMPYVARVLGADLVGVSSYTFSIVTIFGTFALLGINVYGNRTIAANRDNKERTSENFWAIFFIKLFSVTISSAAYLAFISQTNYANKNILLLQSFNLLAIALDVSWLFIGHENFFKITVRNIVVRTISLIGIFTLIKTKEDLGKYVLLIPFANIAGNLLLWPQMIKLLGTGPLFRFSNIKNHIPALMSVFISQAAIQIYTTFDKVIIGLIAGDHQVGVYDYAQKIARISMVVVGSFGTVLMPRIANLWTNNKTDELVSHLQKSLSFSAFIAFPIFFGLIAIAKPLTAVLFPSEFSQISTLLVLLSPCIIFWTINNITGYQIFFPTRNERYLTLSVIVGAFFNALVNVFSVSKFGISGAAITSTLTELIVTGIQVYFALKIINIKLTTDIFKNISKAAIVMFVVIFPIPYFFTSSLLSLAIQLSLGFAIYVFLCWIQKVEITLILLDKLSKLKGTFNQK